MIIILHFQKKGLKEIKVLLPTKVVSWQRQLFFEPYPAVTSGRRASEFCANQESRDIDFRRFSEPLEKDGITRCLNSPKYVI